MEERFVKKSLVRDMTTGSILKHMLVFAIPMIIANACQQIYVLVDTMVAGANLGDSAIAAIGATGALYNFILNFAVGVNSGSAIIVTQSFGAHDDKMLKQSIMGMLQLNIVFTALMTVLSILFMHPLLRIMNVPNEIYEQAYLYIIVICSGMVATVAYNMFAAVLRAFGNSNAPLVFVVIASVLHVILDYVFIAWMGTGVIGAAIATIVSQAVSALISAIYTFKYYREYLPGKEEWKVPADLMRELARVGIAMAFSYTVIDIGTMIFSSANNSLGGAYITAYSGARRLIDLFMIPCYTLGTACATFIGQNYGARQFDRIRRGIRDVIVIEIIWGLAAFAFVYAFAEPMIHIVTSSADPLVISSAVLSLHIHLPMYAPLGVLFAFRFSLQAMGRVAVPIASSSIEMAVKIASGLYFIPMYGFVATCLTEPITWVLCAIFFTIAYIILVKQGLYAYPEDQKG